MNGRDDLREATARVLANEDVDGVLRGSFYVPSSERREKSAPRADKPTHYKVICISMYTEDLERLDEMVENLKARGLTKANRSALIRYALANVKLEDVPKGL
jgi:hypothetical protein